MRRSGRRFPREQKESAGLRGKQHVPPRAGIRDRTAISLGQEEIAVRMSGDGAGEITRIGADDHRGDGIRGLHSPRVEV